MTCRGCRTEPCSSRCVTVGYLSPERFAAPVQIGTYVCQEWISFREALAHPRIADDKRAAGAWTACDMPEGRVNGGKGPVSLLVFDIDKAGPNGLDRTAEACAAYEGIVVPSFSATPENQKHRLVLTLSRYLKPDEFPIAWLKCATDLTIAKIVVDSACKNINRLWFGPVARSRETWLGARILTGKPVEVEAMLRVAYEEEDERQRDLAARLACKVPVSEARLDAYIGAAIDRERRNLLSASEGGRHDALLRATYALARFEALDEDDIRGALLEPFVACAGESRRREGERCIRDAYAARQRLAS